MDILLFGMQGSGKGTQAKILAEKYNLKIFEMGAELRVMVKSGSDLGNRLKSIIESGNLVDDETIMEIVENYLSGLSADDQVLFDGIPRTLPQAKGLLDLLKQHGRQASALYLDVSKEEVVKRMLLRGRDDDNHEVMEKRIGLFLEQTVPVINMFREQGNLVEVNGEQSLEAVTSEILEEASHLFI